MERKFNLKGEALSFKMTNSTIFSIDEKYNNFGDVINGVMYGENLYNNALKVIASSCITRELEVDELIEKLEPKQVTSEIVPFATELYFDYMGIKLSKETEEEDASSKKK